MKIFNDKDIRQLYFAVTAVMVVFLLLSQLAAWVSYQAFSLPLLFLTILAYGGILAVSSLYFCRQNKILEEAVYKIDSYLAGDADSRIECDYEGELYKLFHSVNTLASVLSAHAHKELQAKEFLKGSISDISHQLKTPLAALNIYNGLLQDEAEHSAALKEITLMSEQELDRIETLVQNLLKLAKIDAGSIVLEKESHDVTDMMEDIELHFAYRAKQEQKSLVLSGPDSTTLFCDRDWMIEAVSNIVKNAFDHTAESGHIRVEWNQLADLIQITVTDDGSGIHPEDIHHIFKRFYRSHFSKDTQGLGLGLPLSKAIVEAHDGNLAVDSALGQGCTFVLSFLAGRA